MKFLCLYYKGWQTKISPVSAKLCVLLNKTTTARAYYGYMNKKLGLSHREIAGKSGKSKKVGLFSRLELSERKLLVFLIVAREILLRSKISRGFLQCSNLWAVHVETNKSEASSLDWRCSMFEISCCASSAKDTFTVKGSNTCTAETYWISLTIQFEFSSSSQTWYWSTEISINDTSCACNILWSVEVILGVSKL